MDSEKYTDEELLNMFSNFRPPFEEGSEALAKSKVFERIQGKEANSFGWLKIAAGVLFLFGAAAILLNFTKTSVNSNDGVAQKHELPCGSIVTLSEGGFSYQPLLWSLNRNINFDGKAHFNVAEGNSFKVNSPMGSVLVKGTAFTVWSDDNDLFVHCENGAVDVEYLAVRFKLELNEFCRIDDSIAMDGTLSSQQLNSFLSEDDLSFDDVPLSVVVLKLENVFDIEINSELSKDLRYSGQLSGKDLEEDLRILTKTFNAVYSRDKEGAVLIKH